MEVASMRKWRASLVRKRARVLGDVEALTRQQAEAAAIEKFDLDDEQRNRLVVQERVSGFNAVFPPLSTEMRSFMRRSIAIAMAPAMTSLFALVFWQVEVKATDNVLQKPEYGITANSYLPIQRLRPAF
jgi:hypothetical protein